MEKRPLGTIGVWYLYFVFVGYLVIGLVIWLFAWLFAWLFGCWFGCSGKSTIGLSCVEIEIAVGLYELIVCNGLDKLDRLEWVDILDVHIENKNRHNQDWLIGLIVVKFG